MWSSSFKFIHVTDLFFISISSKEEIFNWKMIKNDLLIDFMKRNKINFSTRVRVDDDTEL